MASVCCPHWFDIDYSLVDGRVRLFKLDGEILFDESRKINRLDWKEVLISLVQEVGLDVDDGRGIHAFVEPLLKQEVKH